MIVKKCDVCKKDMVEPIGYRRFYIFDNSAPHEKRIRPSTTSAYGMPLDICLTCYNKLFNFVCCNKEALHEED